MKFSQTLYSDHIYGTDALEKYNRTEVVNSNMDSWTLITWWLSHVLYALIVEREEYPEKKYRGEHMRKLSKAPFTL